MFVFPGRKSLMRNERATSKRCEQIERDGLVANQWATAANTKMKDSIAGSISSSGLEFASQFSDDGTSAKNSGGCFALHSREILCPQKYFGPLANLRSKIASTPHQKCLAPNPASWRTLLAQRRSLSTKCLAPNWIVMSGRIC